MVTMTNIRKFMRSHNPSFYNPRTGLYDSKSGSFLTRADAKLTSWTCQKCQKGFPSRLELNAHRDEVHSYWAESF